MWVSKHTELGIIKVGSKKSIEFKLIQPCPPGFKIISMQSSCGCSTPIKLPGKTGVKVDYIAKPIPVHLIDKGEYTTTKKIVVSTTEGKFDLTFSVTVRK